MSANRILVLGHRGAIRADAPFHQNSYQAFAEALEASDGFETDACADQDGEVFLLHEAKYPDAQTGVIYCATEHLDAASATLMGVRRIDQMTTEDMRRLRLKDGSPVPSLRETLAMVGRQPGKLINIELKSYGVCPHVLRILDEAFRQNIIAPGSVLVSSSDFEALLQVREVMPSLHLGVIVEELELPLAPMYPWQPGSAARYAPLNAATLDLDVLKQLRPEIFVMPEHILTPDAVALIAPRYPTAKLAGWVFTERGSFDLPAMMERLHALRSTEKIEAMLVDNPRQCRAAFREAGI